MATHQSETNVFDQPILRFPAITGVVTPGGTWDIPLLLTTFDEPTRKPTTGTITGLPILAADNAVGVTVASHGVNSLARIHMEGHITTPTTHVGPNELPNIRIDGTYSTWADFIIMCFEGRSNAFYGKVEPSLFRDPFGRIYTKLKILDFTAAHVEAVPGRTTFTMELKV